MGTPKDPEGHRNYSIGMRQGLTLARYMMTLYLLTNLSTDWTLQPSESCETACEVWLLKPLPLRGAAHC